MTPHPLLAGTTKGPWKVRRLTKKDCEAWDPEYADDSVGKVYVLDSDSHESFVMMIGGPNARLIAAAPELAKENERLEARAEKAERERDAATKRAEAAERELGEAYEFIRGLYDTLGDPEFIDRHHPLINAHRRKLAKFLATRAARMGGGK